MAIAKSSTKMVRLNANLEAVETLQKWRERERGLEGEAVAEVTRVRASPSPSQLLRSQYLRKNSAISALAMPGLLGFMPCSKLDPDGLGHHQKLIIGEATPVNAYYLQAALRSCLVDARILHAGLSNQARARLVDKFNDPKDPLKCLIMMYDVDAVGLNLHHSCNRDLIASIARSFALEEQPGGKTKKLRSMSQDLKMDGLRRASTFSQFFVNALMILFSMITSRR
ncbi:hypothetical protein KCU77_g5245, partial [Aureobasidium melanogenum]